MRTSPRLGHILVYIPLFLTLSSAQFLIDSLSFGHSGPISKDRQSLPGWSLSGSEGYTPRLLSDRIVLTPPAPGNKRGALWTNHEVNYPEWTIDVEFRASGPERGSGNMQVWLTKEKQPTAASVYTVDKFDGLVVELDQYAGSAGAVRGFLSDGSISYKNHHSVDSLSFGHCNYAYRNLGRMSKLKVIQAQDGFEVSVDGQVCFKTDKVQIPEGYYFGLSAASAENPDSFEIAKFLVSTTNAITRDEPRAVPPPTNDSPPPQADANAQTPPEQQEPPNAQTGGATSRNERNFIRGRTGSNPPDAQFYELLNRMEKATNNINSVYRELKAVDERLEQRHSELLGTVGNSANPAAPPPSAEKLPTETLNVMARRLERIEQAVLKSQADLERMQQVLLKVQADIERKDYGEHFAGLAGAIQETRESLLGTLPGIVTSSAPRMWFFIFVIVGVQLVLAGSYVLYKRRRANSPKKLL